MEAIINTLPAPKGAKEEKLKCLLVDSWYDSYLGVVILVRVINGKIEKNLKLKLMSNNQEYIIEKVGVFTPKPTDVKELIQEKSVYNNRNKITLRNKSRRYNL